MKPILRWPGGKGKLLPDIIQRLPPHYRTLHEPFAGGAALTFSLQPPGGYLSDLNPELINFYNVLKQKPQDLMQALLDLRLGEKYFYSLRALDRHHAFPRFCPVRRAARFLFLNRSCFNGLMRVNRLGQLNCSLGAPLNSSHIFDTQTIVTASNTLQTVRIEEASFEATYEKARAGDFVYFDPPYVPRSAGATINYTKLHFTLDHQAGLATLCGKLTKKRVYWMLSNANVPFIRRLYRPYTLHELTARRSLAGDSAARGAVTELLITNY